MSDEEARSIAKGEVGKLALFVMLIVFLIAWVTSKHHDRIKKLETAIEQINPTEGEKNEPTKSQRTVNR